VVPLLLAALAARPVHAADGLATAEADLQAGKADEAISILGPALKANPNDPEANNLLCRVEFTLQQFDQASAYCEQAVQLRPQDSNYHLWFGRALGERADRASFMSAFSLAKRTRAELETAVHLDPRNGDALSDLGEFYKEAPGVVGGGLDKAEEIAKQLDSVEPPRAHLLRGEIAEKQKDLAAAEREYHAAASGEHPAFGWMQLASFYRRQQRWDDMVKAVKSGQAAASHDRRAGEALVNGGSVLSRANRNLDLAIQLYEAYLSSSIKVEQAPAFDILTRLAKLRQQTGDLAGAQRDRSAALALAHQYKPAQELKL
jgi:tetratricopeptide (TPR) repeat protein